MQQDSQTSGQPRPQYPQPYPQQYPHYPPAQQYPPQPQPYPGYGYGYGAQPQPMMTTTYTRNMSFTGKAVIAFLLYFLGYIPGLIFNVMFLNEANNVGKEIGRTPEGTGCLWATLIGSLVPLLGFLAFCVLLAGLIGGTAQH